MAKVPHSHGGGVILDSLFMLSEKIFHHITEYCGCRPPTHASKVSV